MQKARELGWKIGRERREKDVDRLVEKKETEQRIQTPNNQEQS